MPLPSFLSFFFFSTLGRDFWFLVRPEVSPLSRPAKESLLGPAPQVILVFYRQSHIPLLGARSSLLPRFLDTFFLVECGRLFSTRSGTLDSPDFLCAQSQGTLDTWTCAKLEPCVRPSSSAPVTLCSLPQGGTRPFDITSKVPKTILERCITPLASYLLPTRE